MSHSELESGAEIMVGIISDLAKLRRRKEDLIGFMAMEAEGYEFFEKIGNCHDVRIDIRAGYSDELDAIVEAERLLESEMSLLGKFDPFQAS